MTTYRINTDDGRHEIEADSIAEALEIFGAPEHVRDAAGFTDWLDRMGDCGSIEPRA